MPPTTPMITDGSSGGGQGWAQDGSDGAGASSSFSSSSTSKKRDRATDSTDSASASTRGRGKSAKKTRGSAASTAVAIDTDYEAVLLDIEGTTTPISFVKEELFPLFSKNVADFLKKNWTTEDTQADVQCLREQAEADIKAKVKGAVAIPSSGTPTQIQRAAVASCLWQTSINRKSGPLKQLQGHLWKYYYESGDIKGEMYDDVLPALKRWKKEGTPVYIYSSGSRAAQRLIFGYSDKGDLRPYLSGYFDTKSGAKVEAASYENIAETIGIDDISKLLFCTDMMNEATASTEAGVNTVMFLRPGNGTLGLGLGSRVKGHRPGSGPGVKG